MVEGTAYLGERQRNEVKSEAARAKEEARVWRTVGVQASILGRCPSAKRRVRIVS
jgi:hypothetical protein